jgi:hypothetical protein
VLHDPTRHTAFITMYCGHVTHGKHRQSACRAGKQLCWAVAKACTGCTVRQVQVRRRARTCSLLLMRERLLPWPCASSPGAEQEACPPERARCSSAGSTVLPVCTVPPEKLGAECSGPAPGHKTNRSSSGLFCAICAVSSARRATAARSELTTHFAPTEGMQRPPT